MKDPVVELKNSSGKKLYLSGDSNWDDQVLLFDGKKAKSRVLEPRSSAKVAVKISVAWGGNPGSESMMGIVVATDKLGANDGNSFTVGVNAKSQKLDLTEPENSEFGNPGVAYSVTKQTADSLTLEFSDK